MSFDSNTITDPTTPALSLYNALATQLAAAGYTLVDTQVISTRTHKVWKSPAASNLASLDWYLDVAYTTTGAGNLYLYPFEFYDPATHLGYRGPTSATSPTYAAPYYALNGNTGAALESATSGVNPATATTYLFSSCTTSSFGYWMSVTANRVILLNSNQTGQLYYCGLYEPDADHASIAGASDFPLTATMIVAQGSINSVSSGAGNAACVLTRYPLLTNQISGGQNSNSISTYGPDGQVAAYPQMPTGPEVAMHRSGCRVVICSANAGVAPAVWGRFYDVRLTPAINTVTRGDTVTLSGDATQWRMSGWNSNGYSLLFRAS